MRKINIEFVLAARDWLRWVCRVLRRDKFLYAGNWLLSRSPIFEFIFERHLKHAFSHEWQRRFIIVRSEHWTQIIIIWFYMDPISVSSALNAAARGSVARVGVRRQTRKQLLLHKIGYVSIKEPWTNCKWMRRQSDEFRRIFKVVRLIKWILKLARMAHKWKIISILRTLWKCFCFFWCLFPRSGNTSRANVYKMWYTRERRACARCSNVIKLFRMKLNTYPLHMHTRRGQDPHCTLHRPHTQEIYKSKQNTVFNS